MMEMDHAPQNLNESAAEVTWYFDVVSPFAYLALPAIEALACWRSVRLRPVVLSALLSRWGLIGPAEIAPKRLCTYQLVQFTADRAGIPLRFPSRHPFRSLETQRMLATLDGRADAVRAAFDFIWAEGRDPSDPAESAILRARIGAGEPDAAAKDALRASTDDALAKGVFGVPTIVVEDNLFFGMDAIPMAEAYLRDPNFLTGSEMARLAKLPMGNYSLRKLPMGKYSLRK